MRLLIYYYIYISISSDILKTEDKLDLCTTRVNYFDTEDKNFNNEITVTRVRVDEGIILINGKGISTTKHIYITIPAGTYKYTRKYISGTPSAGDYVYFRYGNNTFWNSGTEHTFDSETTVDLNITYGIDFDNCLVQIILFNIDEYSAIDRYTRKYINILESNVENIEKCIDKNVVFDIASQTVGPITIKKLDMYTYKFNGTTVQQTMLVPIILPAGTYKALMYSTSGSKSASSEAVYFRYGAASTAGTYWNRNNELTFIEPTYLTLCITSNCIYTDYVMVIKVWAIDKPNTALDVNSRNHIINIENTLATWLYKAMNMLSKYAVETCVNKQEININSNSTVITCGDSITAGSWPTYFSQIMNCTVINKAVPGALYGESVRSSDKWASTQLAAITESQWSDADFVIMSFGTNDQGYNTPMSELKLKVQSAIDTIIENTQAPILFITPIRCYSNDATAQLIMPEVSGIIANVALWNKCNVLNGWDIPIPSITKGEIVSLLADGLHPNDTGAYIYAMAVVNAIM